MNTSRFPSAPDWQVERWFNTPVPLSLETLRGKVIVLEVFQMLCPGCVSHALPQAQRIHGLFPTEKVAVIGLHSVFEHHAAMNPDALQAFMHEYRIAFPVAVDAHAEGEGIPHTMRSYRLQGTPSLILIDHQGRIRLQHFGRLDDMRVGAEIMSLAGEITQSAADSSNSAALQGCDKHGCALPGDPE